jgi:hypothetical protein
MANDSVELLEVSATIKNYFKELKYNSNNRPYIVIKHVFKKDINDGDLCQNSSTFSSIFQSDDPNVNDHLRKAKNIQINSYKKKSTFGKIMAKSNLVFKNVNSDLKDGKFTLLCSDVNCSEQKKHTDYKIDDDNINHSMFALIALMDNTELIGYQKNGKRITIRLEAGDMLVAREEFIHAGSAYPLLFNVRLHVYYDNKYARIKRLKDTTYFNDSENKYVKYYATCTRMSQQLNIKKVRQRAMFKAKSQKLHEAKRLKKN